MGSPSVLSMATGYTQRNAHGTVVFAYSTVYSRVMTSITAPTAEHRCLRPGCSGKLTSPESIARGYSKACAAKVRAAAKTADLSAWTPSQVEDARQAIEDGAVVPSNREGVFHVVSNDGSEVHLVHTDGCNCTSGLRTLPPRPCFHRCAVVIVLASTEPATPATAPVYVPAPTPAGDLWAELDRMGATGVYAL